MASSLDPDPMTIFPTVFERGWYGDRWYQQYTYWQHPTRMTGGNPVIVFNHGGGWGSGGWNTLIEGISLAHILLVYLLRPDLYDSGDICFDVVTIDTRNRAHAGVSSPPLNSPQEVTLEGTHSGTGVEDAPGNPNDQAEDIQHFVQWLRDHATHFGIDQGDIVLWGESAGSTGCMNAAFGPTRHYTIPTETTDPDDVFSDSLVRGVLNWVGPCSFDPWLLHYAVSGPPFGMAGGADPQGDMELLMLGAAGAAQGTELTPVGKKASPLERIAACPVECTRTRIFSVYDQADLDTTPGTGYVSSPPFVNPHDPRWQPLLEAACATRGITYDSIGVRSRASYGNNRQIFYESTLVETKAWLDEVVS